MGGAFCFCLGDGEIATFGKLEDRKLVSGPDAFHVWLLTDTHIIDFMAPIYREAFADHPKSADLPRRMMQRCLDEEASDLDALVHIGDFRYYPDPDLTDKLLDGFLAKRFNEDLIEVAMAWYGKRRAKQMPTFAMQDEKGRVSRLSFAATVANGSW